MPFTNVYDVTFPPDTQLANLLGSDLRNLALNVQQRMAAISGTLANRPNLLLDAQPVNWAGLLYFTTDTKQIFQWSGAVWVDLTSTLLPSRTIFKDTTIHVHTGDTTNDTIYTIPVAANLLGTNGTLRVTIQSFINSQTNTGNTTLFASFGGANVLQAPYTNASTPFFIQMILSNRGLTNSQVADSLISNSAVQPAQPFFATSVIDTTLPQNLIISVQNFINSDSQRFDSCIVELL